MSATMPADRVTRANSIHTIRRRTIERPTVPGRDSILGRFTAGENILKTANPDLYFQMDEKQVDGKDSFFQTAVAGPASAYKFALGAHCRCGWIGREGQMYLYWNEDQLFRLPVSYWTKLGWVNSPGYRDGLANFDRPIIPRCVECRATYVEAMPPPVNKSSNTGFALGISCEKCHGPGRQHLERERSKPSLPAATAVLNPVHFSRDRRYRRAGRNRKRKVKKSREVNGSRIRRMKNGAGALSVCPVSYQGASKSTVSGRTECFLLVLMS
jgi:hypothetical protein